MNDDKKQDYTVMNRVLYFSNHFLFLLCEIAYLFKCATRGRLRHKAQKNCVKLNENEATLS